MPKHYDGNSTCESYDISLTPKRYNFGIKSKRTGV
jgi:hypothetical protein